MGDSQKTQTLVLFKPDALKNSLTGYLLTMLSEFNTGLIIAGMKIIHVNALLAEEHYAEHKGKSFFPFVIEYIQGLRHFPGEPKRQRVIAIIYEGTDAIQVVRDIAGPTDPTKARSQKPGCIRSLGMTVPIYDDAGNIIEYRMDNLIHASANSSDAEREIKLWFKPNELPPALRLFPVSVSKSMCYYKDGIVCESYSDGAVCIVAPGDLVWTSDLESIEAHIAKKSAAVPIDAIVAKYCTNSI